MPVWLLDVDGVLNAARPGWGGPPRRGTASDGHASYPMRWAPPLTERLTALHRAGVVEFRWATTWVDEIAQVADLLRLPTWPVAFSGLSTGVTRPVPEIKAEAALAVVEQEHRPLLWTDDDAIPADGTVIDRLNVAGLPVLLVAPDARTGLQPEHLEAIEAFIARCAERADPEAE